jgi:hypothetical protein
MGLETGWNCHISLAEGTHASQTDGQSQLPRGIANIRPHLAHVDDVPLLVPLFTDCTALSTCEMMRIMQDHGEVVAALGSSLRPGATHAFATADISIGIEPQFPKQCLNVAGNTHYVSGTPRLAPVVTKKGKEPPGNTARYLHGMETPVLALAADFNNTPCSLAIGRNTSLYIVLHLVREARRMAYNARNMAAFLIGMSACPLHYMAAWPVLSCPAAVAHALVLPSGCCLAVSLAGLVACVALLPPVVDGLQILWICVVAAPVLAVALVSAEMPQALMEVMPDKNKDHLKDIKRYIAYFFLRFAFSSIVAVAVFATALHGLCEARAPGQCDVCGLVSMSIRPQVMSGRERRAAVSYLRRSILARPRRRRGECGRDGAANGGRDWRSPRTRPPSCSSSTLVCMAPPGPRPLLPRSMAGLSLPRPRSADISDVS